MSSEQQPQPSAAGTQAGPGGPTSQAEPSEEDLRTAYEAELNRITSAEMIIQTTVSLINIAGRRLGLAPAAAGADPSASQASERDLEQVRDAIDGAGALMPILERRMPGEMAPLRDAIAQLQVAYAREAQGSASTSTSSASTSTSTTPESQAKAAGEPEKPAQDDQATGPGPAQSSGRLWVPGS